VLRIDDPAALSGNRMPAMNANAPQQGETRLYIDAERYVPLRLESEVSVERNGESQTLRPRILLSDYRTTDGLTLPWSMEMKMENLDATISAEEREQARRSLEEMEQRMQEMPEEQRQMMEGMMKNQLEQLRNILDEGSIQFAIEVQDVQVNAPLPDDVFSGGSN
jgi:small-conductance mechanosensitive channel